VPRGAQRRCGTVHRSFTVAASARVAARERPVTGMRPSPGVGLPQAGHQTVDQPELDPPGGPDGRS